MGRLRALKGEHIKMADYNNNGKDDLIEVLEQARDQMQAAHDRITSRSTDGDDYSRTRSQSTINVDREKVKRVKKIIKTVIIVYILIQFAPMFIGGIIMMIGLFAELNDQIEATAGKDSTLTENIPHEDNSISIDMNDVLFKVEEIGENIQAWFYKTFDTSNLFANSGNTVLIILAALVIGIILILVLRAVTTKKGLTDEEITTELRNRESTFATDTNSEMESDTSVSERIYNDSNTSDTAEEDAPTGSNSGIL